MKLQSKIEALRQDSATQEDFMRSLAKFDENGRINDENLEKLIGGIEPPVKLPWPPTTAGMFPVRDNQF